MSVFGDLLPVEAIKDPHNIMLELKINGETKQKDLTGNMHFKIDEQLEYVSKYMTLNPGDVILTGTPEGIAPMKEGDELVATMSQDG
eukprot:CAMPEP_0176371472 /NCGR_PEP_ID=MMETSP0126-20121128/24724_1 /TAXON_ID=141414 ORGANISM="Strombidinopsis acuminatum, Strain SPMC142" /NCGR_SAMPLE_ID=MMETSP0126 /ASSEMBLY_ACC=CAM_ASM_000229 /LENGTH=86 /DNA_ID=CAMNT_0017730947 /DNA_START=448 /DNA_END=708 /DNA_ORIENTATION=-